MQVDGLAVLVASGRPPVHAFFDSLGVTARRVDVDGEGIESARDVDVAVVDFGVDAPAATKLVAVLRAAEQPPPIAALLCCAHSVTPRGVRALAAAGASSVLDLQMTAEEALRALRDVARGIAVLHISFGGRSRATLHDVVSGDRPRRDDDIRLLELVSRGLPDREIGLRLHLSPHTVKKRVEQLREDVGARNRIELAAWAGRQGFYAGATRTA